MILAGENLRDLKRWQTSERGSSQKVLSAIYSLRMILADAVKTGNQQSALGIRLNRTKTGKESIGQQGTLPSNSYCFLADSRSS